MPLDFWDGVAQIAFGSAIGSGLAFVFGILAFRYQQDKQSAKKKKDDLKEAIDVLNHLTIVAGTNMVKLLKIKRDYINKMVVQAQEMKAVCDKLYPMPLEGIEIKAHHLIKSVPSDDFFTIDPVKHIMVPPEYSEYSAVGKYMPALPSLAHHAVSFMHETNIHTESRNAHVDEYISKDQNSPWGSITEAKWRIRYNDILAQEGIAIATTIDQSLFFWDLVVEQIKNYTTVMVVGGEETIHTFDLSDEGTENMPAKDLYPSMRDQLRTFEKEITHTLMERLDLWLANRLIS